MEGYLSKCLGYECPSSCCRNGVAEKRSLFEQSPRAQIKAELEALGIRFTAESDMTRMKDCGGPDGCKVLQHRPKEDIRPLACKIFPYKLFSDYQRPQFVYISLSRCPATEPGFCVPQKFTQEVIYLVKAHFQEYFGLEVEVKVFEGVKRA